jgi:hypothetical protein
MALDRNTREVWEQVSTVLLAEHPKQDASEHLGLLTVMVGLRSVALFLDVDEPNATRVIRLVTPLGLTAFTTNGPTVAYTWQSAHPPEIAAVFRSRSPSKGVWVCRNRDDARLIRGGITQIEAGRLLGYPQCCIGGEQGRKADFEDAVIRGYLRKFGGDPHTLARACAENRKVLVDYDPVNDRTPRARARFPFVQHVACEFCLTAEGTPTAVLNSEYEQLVAGVDPILHDYLAGVGKATARELVS